MWGGAGELAGLEPLLYADHPIPPCEKGVSAYQPAASDVLTLH